MRIFIQAEGHTFRFRLPNWLLSSPRGWKFISKYISKDMRENRYGALAIDPIPLAPPKSQDLRTLKRALKKLRKQTGGFTLVDIETEDGEIVRIKL